MKGVYGQFGSAYVNFESNKVFGGRDAVRLITRRCTVTVMVAATASAERLLARVFGQDVCLWRRADEVEVTANVSVAGGERFNTS